MQNGQGRSRPRTSGQPAPRQSRAFQAACNSVFGLSTVATAVIEDARQSLCYANRAFWELAGETDDPGGVFPWIDRFPKLVAGTARALLDRVQHSGYAASSVGVAPYVHPRRGQVLITLTAWPCGVPAARTVIQFLEVKQPKASGFEELARDLRTVNERLLVAGVHQHELAEEASRRQVIAEQAAERSETALQSSVVQTQSLARRLITAQESERMRLARELHDDVNQQLAGLSISLSALRADLPENLVGMRADLDRLQQRTTLLIDTIRDLSHELHPGSLRTAGLLPALHHLCAEFEKHGGTIELRTDGDLANVPGDVALTLYRVAQEALRNVTQHARAQHTSVVLTNDAQYIRLQIADDGCGFLNHEINRGLGLLGMEERVLGVNGDLAIDSIPGAGTRIELSIPATPVQRRSQADATESQLASGGQPD